MRQKEKIMLVASENFYKYGVKSVTMDDIATQMGISKRTIYEKFKDKEDLLIECILFENKLNQEEAEKIHQDSDNVLEVCMRLQKKHIDRHLKINPKYYSDIQMYYSQAAELIESIGEQASKKIMLMFGEGVKQGVFRDDVNFEIVRMMLKVQMKQLLSPHFDGKYDLVDVYDTVIYTFMRGISTLKGQEVLDEFMENGKLKK